jgi:integrase
MSNVKFSFFLKSRTNNLNQNPIVMTITMNQDRTQLFTGIWVDKKKWNEKTKRIKGQDEETITLNDTLLTMVSHARQVSNELLISGKPFNPNTIKEKLKNGFNKSYGVVESFEVFLIRMEKLIPSKYTKSTLTKYTNTKERVKEFIKVKTQRNDIYLYELESQFMEDFDLWLRKTYKVSHNTIYKTYQRFTRFLRNEVSKGNLDKYPFPDYEIKMEVKQGHYLTYDEIQKLEQLELNLPRLDQVRHLFIFATYVGLAFIDLEMAKETDLIQDEEGMFWLRTFRQKSKSRVSVPLISNAVKSLNYLRSGIFQIPEGRLLPVKSNVHLNLEIKQICGLAGINNSENITWHCARRSTSSLMMKAGIPLQILQKVLSHKSLHTSLQFYSHTDDVMVKEAMIELDKRLNDIK